MSISLEQIFKSSLEQLQQSLGEILTPRQRELFNKNPDTDYEMVYLTYRNTAIKKYYENNMLDMLSTWLINKYQKQFWFELHDSDNFNDLLRELK